MLSRTDTLSSWLNTLPNLQPYTLQALTGDASFRRYFRLFHLGKTYIVMDAPPEQEALSLFLDRHALLHASKIRVPDLFEKNISEGFLLLEDFGDELLLSNLNQSNASQRYEKALNMLIQLRQSSTQNLPLFDHAFIQKELELFNEWFVKKLLGVTLTRSIQQQLSEFFSVLTDTLIQQPQCFVHRDYHSRNIMIIDSNQTLGLIDFQDACLGPCTYDLVSLLKDCYIEWPKDTQESLLHSFYEQLPQKTHSNFQSFVTAFDCCGLQRHLKILGIFSRLHLRDQKSAYLKDLPLTFKYVTDCLSQYDAFHPIAKIFDTYFRPAFQDFQKKQENI